LEDRKGGENNNNNDNNKVSGKRVVRMLCEATGTNIVVEIVISDGEIETAVT
jgi:hypothetical protein